MVRLSGSIFRMDPVSEVITEVFDSNMDQKGLDWKPLQYVNDTILIRGVGPLQCYELSTMERKWTCVLPHQLQVVSNAIEWGKNQILVSDENSNFHVIDIQTGKIVKSYSAETPCWMPLKQSILPINNKLVVTTRENNRVFLSVLSLN